MYLLMSSSWSTHITNVIPIIPKYFSGSSLIKTSKLSMYGKFTKTISDILSTEEKTKLTIPTVIVIGSESSGKSSLLENIYKCPVFPRSSRICTKLPIHVELSCANNEDEISYSFEYKDIKYYTNKHTINRQIKDIMDSLNDTISDDIITINICDLDLPHMKFIDLPGIRAYPQDMAEQTSKLTEKYLCQPDTIILCVVPATIPRLTSYTPIALIKKHNKMENTFMVLTMCDKVHDENIGNLIVDRLCSTSDEFEGRKFAGYHAVINRNTDSITLIQNNKREVEWFLERIINISEDFEHKNKLIENIGTNVLINNIDIMYNNHIKTNWIPNTIESIQENIFNLENKLFDIGPLFKS